ncbi:vacuolar protein sorting 51 [Dermatophagoides pteronyssinus]|uniref:vacuolar protein sorting 51 n=1 Tax=Dermatophagoides pteronyssinus TaxID=6956 RepID=UPI003F66C398
MMESKSLQNDNVVVDDDDDDYICDPCDMNSTDFNPDIYMIKILKESRLSELMDTEQMLYKQIQTLDSEMQTLIYENYNKFISATETVKKMTSHFDKMEYELNLLSENMDKITGQSNEIGKNLNEKREQMIQMSTKNQLLEKIQFILELPNKMKQLIEQNQYDKALDDYLDARQSLNKYAHLSSFKNIQMDCNEMLAQIKQYFYGQLANENLTTTQLNKSIGYLIRLNECPKNLCEKYFEMCEKKMNIILDEIRNETTTTAKSTTDGIDNLDILEFIDNVCNHYIDSLNECIKFYTDCFVGNGKNELSILNDQQISNDDIESRLKIFIDRRMNNLFELIVEKIRYEQHRQQQQKSDKISNNNNNVIMFVRALDRFYRRVQMMNNFFGYPDFSRKSLSIIFELTKDQCRYLVDDLMNKFQDELTTIRHDIVQDMTRTTNLALKQQRSSNVKHDDDDHRNQNTLLSDTVIAFETSICENLKSILSNLNPFLYPELTFMLKDFKEKFIKNLIFDTIVIKYLDYILENIEQFEQSYQTSHIPSCFILILSKICRDLSNSIIQYLFKYTDELFSSTTAKFTGSQNSAEPLIKRSRLNGEKLLNAYVWIEGQSITHMIRKSVETRDWMSTVEPRSVRSVMKRMIEDITLIDFLVGQLYEEGVRIERSSDSTSRTFSSFSINNKSTSRYSKSNWSYGSSSFIVTDNNNIVSNIQKLFNDKIEIFGSVEFSKLSIVTGIIKIGLKTLIECVRLCTFSRYGFQQIQVDSYYLQTRLWRFASDEKIIMNLIDDVIISSKKRCLDPVGMERSVIENICENR